MQLVVVWKLIQLADLCTELQCLSWKWDGALCWETNNYWAKWSFYLQQKAVSWMSSSLLLVCVGCPCPRVWPADVALDHLSTENHKKMLLPPSELELSVPCGYWHWSYARNPLFALPSLWQIGRTFKDPVHGSVGTAGSLFSSCCSQEWSRGSSAEAILGFWTLLVSLWAPICVQSYGFLLRSVWESCILMCEGFVCAQCPRD